MTVQHQGDRPLTFCRRLSVNTPLQVSARPAPTPVRRPHRGPATQQLLAFAARRQRPFDIAYDAATDGVGASGADAGAAAKDWREPQPLR
jgi:hypothetical protein